MGEGESVCGALHLCMLDWGRWGVGGGWGVGVGVH